MTKKFEVTFHMNSGKEIGHLVKANSEKEAQTVILSFMKREFFSLSDDLVLVSKHIEYFHLAERED